MFFRYVPLVLVLAGCQSGAESGADMQPEPAAGRQSAPLPLPCGGAVPPVQDRQKLQLLLEKQGVIRGDMSAEEIQAAIDRYIAMKNQPYRKCARKP